MNRLKKIELQEKKQQIEAEYERQMKEDEEWMENNPIEEEDDPDPWDLPTPE